MRCSMRRCYGRSARRQSEAIRSSRHSTAVRCKDAVVFTRFNGEVFMSIKQIASVGVIALCALAASSQQPNSIFKGKKMLLVAATSSPTAPVDANIKKHFESLGMIVNMVPDINPPPADGYDLVFLASDVKAKTITNSYRTTNVPIFTLKPWLLDFLGMTGYEPHKDYGED